MMVYGHLLGARLDWLLDQFYQIGRTQLAEMLEAVCSEVYRGIVLMLEDSIGRMSMKSHFLWARQTDSGMADVTMVRPLIYG